MYKRTIQAIINDLPTKHTRGGYLMGKAQFGSPEYNEIAYAITTRIDASGAYFLAEVFGGNEGNEGK